MAQRIKNVESMVKSILEKSLSARDSDEFLYFKVVQKYNLEHCNVGDFLLVARIAHNVPSFETVGRARRKLQEKYPTLRGTHGRQMARAEAEKDFEAYALS